MSDELAAMRDEFADMDRRALEIITELRIDGYPYEYQLTIVADALVILLAHGSKNKKELMKGVVNAKGVIEKGAKKYFEDKGMRKPGPAI
jgi:hypothetical protein